MAKRSFRRTAMRIHDVADFHIKLNGQPVGFKGSIQGVYDSHILVLPLPEGGSPLITVRWRDFISAEPIETQVGRFRQATDSVAVDISDESDERLPPLPPLPSMHDDSDSYCLECDRAIWWSQEERTWHHVDHPAGHNALAALYGDVPFSRSRENRRST